MTIQSNLSEAAQYASSITASAANIAAVRNIQKDTDSQYTGNSEASTHIDKEQSYSNQIASQVNQFVDLLHSVASEFEAIDTQLSQSIASNPVTRYIQSSHPDTNIYSHVDESNIDYPIGKPSYFD